MKQQTLAMAADQGDGFEPYRKPTKRDTFLATMEQIMPWQALCSVIEPHYPKAGNGRPPIGLERMLRMYFVQHWFNLADEACEEALLDSTGLRRFVDIDLGRERVPDGTTLLKFRRLLEQHKLGEALFAKVGEVLQARGLKVGNPCRQLHRARKRERSDLAPQRRLRDRHEREHLALAQEARVGQAGGGVGCGVGLGRVQGLGGSGAAWHGGLHGHDRSPRRTKAPAPVFARNSVSSSIA